MKISQTASLLALLVLTAAVPVARADFSNCTPETYLEAPAYEGRLWSATLTTTCELKGSIDPGPQGTAGMAALEIYLNDTAAHSAEVHAGPIADQLDGLPAQYYDVTDADGEGDQALKIRGDVWIGADLNLLPPTLAYRMHSKSVTGGGKLNFLRRVNLDFKIIPASTSQHYTAVFANRITLERPVFAPEPVFSTQADAKFHESFRDTIGKLKAKLESEL